MLGAPREQRPAIKEFVLQGEVPPIETKMSAASFGGQQRSPMFAGEARALLNDDIRGYVSSRFVVDPAAAPIVTINLARAYVYFSRHHSAAALIPLVGIAVTMSEMHDEFPVTFVVEAKAAVSTPGQPGKEIDVFLRQSEETKLSGITREKIEGIYRREIEKIRTDLFARLDLLLLGQWQQRKFVGPASTTETRAANLASELTRLDVALADDEIKQPEHDNLVAATKARVATP